MSNSNRYFLFAVFEEASAIIETFDAQKLNEYEYQIGNDRILIIGMGLLEPLIRLSNIKANELINLGCAGALNPNLKLFDPVNVKKVSLFLPKNLDTQELKTALKVKPPIEIQKKGVHLATCSYPIKTDKTKQEANGYDLVDMEGYTIAYFAKKYSIPLTMIKVPSDFANEGSVIKERLHQVSNVLLSVFESHFLPQSTK